MYAIQKGYFHNSCTVYKKAISTTVVYAIFHFGYFHDGRLVYGIQTGYFNDGRVRYFILAIFLLIIWYLSNIFKTDNIGSESLPWFGSK